MSTLKYCSVKNCINTSKDHILFQFPRRRPNNKVRQKLIEKWIRFCGDENFQQGACYSKKRYICENHFDEKVRCRPPFSNNIVKNAIPTLNGPKMLGKDLLHSKSRADSTKSHAKAAVYDHEYSRNDVADGIEDSSSSDSLTHSPNSGDSASQESEEKQSSDCTSPLPDVPSDSQTKKEHDLLYYKA